MTRQDMIDMKARFAEAHAFEIAERRAATPAMRMRQLDGIWLIATELGIKEHSRKANPAPADQWMKLREAMSERERIAPQ